jgi:apolipoprotein N-acyltransferase
VLAWVHLVPLAWALRGAGPGDGARVGFVYGFLFILVTDWWVSNALAVKTGLGPVAAWGWTGVFCAWQALPYLAAGWAAGLGWRAGWRGARWCLWSAAGLTVAVSLVPVVFPGNAAHALYRFPLFLQVLDLGGVPLLLFLLAACSWLAAERLACARFGRAVGLGGPVVRVRRVAALSGCFSLLVLFWAGYGWLRLAEVRAIPARAEATLAAVQPDVPVRPEAIEAGGGPDAQFSRTLALSGEVARRAPEAALLVLPELPLDVPCDPAGREQRLLAAAAAVLRTPVLANCVAPRGDGAWINAARLVRPRRLSVGGGGERAPSPGPDAAPDGGANADARAQGDAGAVSGLSSAAAKPSDASASAPGASPAAPADDPDLYVKRRLVPFGERVPFSDLLPWLARFTPSARPYAPGAAAVVLRTDAGLRVGPLLCYESLFPGEVRDLVNGGAEVLAAMADDAWFASARAAAVHLSMVLPRAVEFRVPLVRAGNDAASAVILPTGEFVAGSPASAGVGGVAARVRLVEIGSTYAARGDVFLHVLCAAWLLAAALAVRGGGRGETRGGSGA